MTNLEKFKAEMGMLAKAQAAVEPVLSEEGRATLGEMRSFVSDLWKQKFSTRYMGAADTAEVVKALKPAVKKKFKATLTVEFTKQGWVMDFAW